MNSLAMSSLGMMSLYGIDREMYASAASTAALYDSCIMEKFYQKESASLNTGVTQVLREEVAEIADHVPLFE